MGGCQNASERPLTFEIRGRADAGQHGRGRIAEQEEDIFSLIRKILCQFGADRGLPGGGAPPNGKDLGVGFRFRCLRRTVGVALEDAAFLKIEHG